MSDNETPSGLAKAINIGPRTKLHMTLGTLYGGAGVLLSAAFFIWGIYSKVNTMADDVSSIKSDLKPALEHTAILWDEHERTATYRTHKDVK